MIKKIQLICCLGIVFSCKGQQVNDLNKTFTVEELMEDLTILQKELEQNHPGLYNYKSKTEINNVFYTLKQSLTHELNTVEFYRKLAQLNSVIKDAHTKVLVPQPFQRAINDTLSRFPFALHYDGQKLFVLRNLSNNETIQTGWEIKSINGITTNQLIKKITKTISRDGYNQSSPIAILNQDFGGFYAYVFGCPKQFDIGFLDVNQEPVNYLIEALQIQTIMSNSKKRYPSPRRSNLKAFSLNFKDEVAVLTVSSFIGDKYEDLGKPFKKAFKEAFKTLQSRQTENLIIDVRNNKGGWSEVADELLSYLIKTPFRHYKSEFALVNNIENKDRYLRDGYISHFEKLRFKKVKNGFLTTWREPMIKPKKEHFKGNVYVLINGKTASQASEFSGLLKDKTKAIIIGEETRGNPELLCGGHIATLILPNTKIRIEIPLQKVEVNINLKTKGRGLIPDIIIDNSMETVIAKEDRIMRYTLNLIKEK